MGGSALYWFECQSCQKIILSYRRSFGEKVKGQYRNILGKIILELMTYHQITKAQVLMIATGHRTKKH